MSVIIVHDAIGANVSHLPPGPAAGYVTGLPPVPWTAAQLAGHPGVVRIAQSPNLAADEGVDADVLDIESGAATMGEASAWYRQALVSYVSGAHPGQRHPMMYVSASNVTALVDALIAGGVRSGPALWIANWNLSDPQAAAAVAAASGPYPVEAVQFTDNAATGGLFDTSVFSTAWLDSVSGARHPLGGPTRHTLVTSSLYGFSTGRGANWREVLKDTAGYYTEGDAKRHVPGMIVYTDNP